MPKLSQTDVCTDKCPLGTQCCWFPVDLVKFWQVHCSTATFALSRRRKTINNPRVGTRGGGQGTNKCEVISIVQVRQRAYTKPDKAGSPPATQKCQGKVSASALVVGNREGFEKYHESTPLLQKATNRSKRAEETKGPGSGEDPMN